ncbi:hypothetical protein [Leadbetterella sp. DM7]
MKNPSKPGLSAEKKKWVKPEIAGLAVNTGLSVKNIPDFFAYVQAS